MRLTLIADYNGVLAGQGDPEYQQSARIQRPAVEALFLFARYPNNGIIIATGQSYRNIHRQLETAKLTPHVDAVVAEHGSVIGYPRDGKVVHMVSREPAKHLREAFLRYMNHNGTLIENKDCVFAVQLGESGLSVDELKYNVDNLVARYNSPLRTVVNGNTVEAVHPELEDGYGSGKVKGISLRLGGDWTGTAYVGDGPNDIGSLWKSTVAACPSNAKPKVRQVVKSKNGIAASKPEGEGTLEIVNILLRMGVYGI